MAKFPANNIMSLVAASPRYDLAESVGPDLHLGDLFDADALQDLSQIALGYGTAEGDQQLRQVIAEGHAVDADDVVVTVGGMHALFLTAFILCEHGDKVVTTAPLFPLACNALEAVGADVHTARLSFDRGYRLNLSDMIQALSAQTKLVSLASPQNPSGVAIPLQTLRELLALMADRCPAAYLLVDETFREAAYGTDPIAASAVGLSSKVISIASLSKCHGAPGLRLGWAITRDRDLRAQLVLSKFNTVISCSALDEALALRVLQQRDRIIDDRRVHLAAGLAKTASWVQHNATFVEWIRPDAGALCCIRLRPSVFDAAAVTRFQTALTEARVRLADGTWFGDETHVFRLGFGLLTMPDLERALNGVSAALRRSVCGTTAEPRGRIVSAA